MDSQKYNIKEKKKTKSQKLELPYNPAIPLLGIYIEEIRIERDTCTPVFTAALFTITRTWKQPRCPLADEWIRNFATYTQWILLSY